MQAKINSVTIYLYYTAYHLLFSIILSLQKCEEGQVQLRDVFSRLRHQVDERETDLRQELTTVRDNAGMYWLNRHNN